MAVSVTQPADAALPRPGTAPSPAADRPERAGTRRGRGFRSPAPPSAPCRLRGLPGSATSGVGLRRRAASSTCSMLSTRTSLICLRISSGMSRRSFSFFLRQDDHLGARKVRRQDLALEPADRQNPAAEGDLAGHGHVLADRDAGEGADHGQGHRDPRRRAVLGDAAGRDVDVQGVLLEDLALDAEL